MDIRSIVNDSEATDNAASRPPAPPTPSQTAPPPPPPPLHTNSFPRDYAPSNLTPSKHPSQDFGSPSQDLFHSPTAYHPAYPNRPPPPNTAFAPPPNDLRSPSAAHYPVQSPYHRQSTTSVGSGQYPFPQAQTPHSPAQTHPQQLLQHRDSYPINTQPPYAYPRQLSPVAQAPPIGTPGGYASFQNQHQRSLSQHSVSTPTSAHGPGPYPLQYTHESPVSAGSYPPPPQYPQAQHQRQQSQPGTPLGPPLSTSAVRHSSGASGGYPQPHSPLLQRAPSQGPLQYQHQASPAPAPYPTARMPSTPGADAPPPPARMPSTPGAQDGPPSTSEFNRRSQSEREASLSVSPKTRVPSQPSRTESFSQPPTMPDILNDEPDRPIKSEPNQSTAHKRKFDEREVSEPASTTTTNENSAPPEPVSAASKPPAAKRQKVRYTEVPIWAQSYSGKQKYSGKPYINKKVEPARMNGNQRPNQAGPAVSLTPQPNGHNRPSPGPVKQGLPARDDGRPGPGEHCITGRQPFEEIPRLVADWLFTTVISRPDAGELASRRVAIEIEAKLGQLVDKETNDRIRLPVQSECVLSDNGRTAFKSSMTEAQHKRLNDFLNSEVANSHPKNPERGAKRIMLDYKHRHEVDRFYELPPRERERLPPSIKELLGGRREVKVRVSTNEKGQIIAKIIKARVTNLDIHLPNCPLDCRISVNLEMDYDGDVDMLMATAVDAPRLPGRNKDRLSYRQLWYQVDLTQVTVADSATKSEKEHELEIEVDALKLAEQGRLAANGQPNSYPDIVQGFVDNVRILARATPRV